MRDTLLRIVHIKQLHTKLATIVAQRVDAFDARRMRLSGAARQRRQNMIDHREIEIQVAHRALDAAQAVERLAVSAVVEKMPVDVQQRAAIGKLAYDMLMPDFVDQRLRCVVGHELPRKMAGCRIDSAKQFVADFMRKSTIARSGKPRQLAPSPRLRGEGGGEGPRDVTLIR